MFPVDLQPQMSCAETADHGLACTVRHFRMELHAVELALFVGRRRSGSSACCPSLKPGGISALCRRGSSLSGIPWPSSVTKSAILVEPLGMAAGAS
jgi:hypothetical protein